MNRHDEDDEKSKRIEAIRPMHQDVDVNGRTFRITVQVTALEPGGGGQGGGGGGDFSG